MFQSTTTSTIYSCKYITCNQISFTALPAKHAKSNSMTNQTFDSTEVHFPPFQHQTQKKPDAVGLHFSQTNQDGIADVTINILDFIHLPPS